MSMITKGLTVFFLIFSVFLNAGVFSDLGSAQLLFGKKIDLKELKGKVVFFEYWGITCPPCRASIPELVSLQRQYAKTGKFTVIASHVVNNLDDKAIEFLKSEDVNFPVYQQFNSKEAPCGRGIPHSFIIDAKGKIVAEGYPSRLYDKIKEILKATTPPPPEILTGVKLKYWKNIESRIKSGKRFDALFGKLKKAAKNDTPEGLEAKEIVTKITENLLKMFKELEKESNTEPLDSFKKVKSFMKQTVGLKINGDASSLYTELSSDIYLKKIKTFKKEVEKIIMKMRGHRSKSLFKKSKMVKVKLNKLIDSSMVSDRAKNAAKRLIKHIDNNI